MTNFFSPTSSPNQPTKPKGHTVQISTSDVDDEDDHDSTDVSGEVCSSKRNKFGLRICPRSGFAHDFEWFFNEYGETLGGQLWFEADVDNDTASSKSGQMCLGT